MKTPELMARETLKNSSLEKLLDLWELTDKMNGPQVPTVRGWLMDEIERRNPDLQFFNGGAGGLRVFLPQGGDLPRVGQGVILGQLCGLVLYDQILLVDDGAQGRDHFHLVHRRRAPFAPTPISAAICRRSSTLASKKSWDHTQKSA